MKSTRRGIRSLPIVVVGLFFAVWAWPGYVAGVMFGLWQPITRPKGVPASARYVSRIEDGTWFDCTVDLGRNVDVCRAWDYSGHLIANGDFRLEGEERAATARELKPSAVISSGGHAYMIYLFGKNGAHTRALVPIDASHPHTTGCKWDASASKLSCD